ncbi:hypothetical protein DSCO28_03410 [Desulfosarcina ovata subsp. sediminis]|uniref:Uncharacterized protein n=1 Tax=Desulfosarcina ovata subsp. sediminis TaxID=885957 RepID=A0A5K7ZHN3_9BACT|nr:tetratricopeptide repeat protein [Desulfosarcina ovata]BBO79775.1 hypothetical protein DSCO28_03410 [Desulfosarcina ovata subsp. sediminis]
MASTESFDRTATISNAVTLHRHGELDQASAIYARIIEKEPGNADAFHLLGLIAMEKGDYAKAGRSILHAIKMNPENALYYVSLGDLYQCRKDREKQIASYRQALMIDPDLVKALYRLGKAYAETERFAEAAICLRQAIENNPDVPELYYELGEVYAFQKDFKRAYEAFDKAIERKPDYTAAMISLANLLRDQGHFPEADSYYRQAMQLEPDSTVLKYSRGIFYHMQHAYDEARDCYQQVIDAHPAHYGVHVNMGKLFQDRNDYANALIYYQRAQRIDPANGDARFYRSLVLLSLGEFEQGWKEYEARLEREKWQFIYPYRLSTPRWRDEPLEGKTIFVHSEQGFGDTIQFVRYLPLLKQRGGRVVFEVRPQLFDLLQGFPGVDFMVSMAGKPPVQSNIDYHVPLLSLPGIFKTDLETIPGAVPYITADAEKVRLWETRRSEDDFNVGLVWLAKPSYRHNKSCPLKILEPIFSIPKVSIYGLQKFDDPKDHAMLPFKIDNWGDGIESFADTAAAIQCLDLIVTVDTAVAHLAGAMGKRVFTLLPFSADWRWSTKRNDSPWYPTMTLYRQVAVDDWKGIVDRIVKDLSKAAAYE